MLSLLCLFVWVAATATCQENEVGRYQASERAFETNRTARESAVILARLQALLDQRALCTRGTTLVGMYDWDERPDAVRRAIDVMRTRGWNVSLANVTMGGYTRDSFFAGTGPCLVDHHVDSAHCYRSLDAGGVARAHLKFDGQWWLGFLICYRTVPVLYFTLQ